MAILSFEGSVHNIIDIVNEIKSKIPLNYDILLIEAKMRERDERTKNKQELKIGAKYKNFTAVTPGQKPIALSDILEKKQYVLLEFWASWCGPCREQMKFLPAIYNKYRKKGFEIYSFSVDSKYDNWIKASQEMDMPWINTSNDSDGVNAVSKLYSISSIPNNYLLDKNGIIVAINISHTQLSNFLELKTL